MFGMKLAGRGIDFSYQVIKKLAVSVYQLMFIILFCSLIFTLILPQVVLFILHDCFTERNILTEECTYEMRDIPRLQYYKQVFHVCLNNLQYLLEPFFDAYFDIYTKFYFRRLWSDIFGDAARKAFSHGFRSCSVAGEDFFITKLNQAIRIIFDSGASTNLVFYPLPGDTVVGPRQLNLAAGETSSGHITMSGEVTLPDELVSSKKCTEELISMGRFAGMQLPDGQWYAKVVWEGDTCILQLKDCNGNYYDLMKLPIERNCPMMTHVQAKQVREIQRAAVKGDFRFAAAGDFGSSPLGDDSPSLAILEQTSDSFDYFYQLGQFDDILSLMAKIAPSVLRNWWKRCTPETFHQYVQLYEPDTSVAQSVGENPTEGLTDGRPDQPTSDARELEFYRADRAEPILGQAAAKVKVGSNPNAQKSPQSKTSVQDKLKFYRSTKGAWVIFGDIHFSSVKGYEGSDCFWIFHCTRLVAKNPKKPKLEEIETVELNFPFRRPDNNAVTACGALRHALESLGIWSESARTRKNFFFESEEETAIQSNVFKDYLISVNGSHHLSVPYRHPAKEFAVRNLLRRIRTQLDLANLPPTAWPSIAMAVSQEQCRNIKGRTYENKTFQNGYKVEYNGRYVYAHVPGLDRRSVDSKQVPAMLLHCAPRNRVFIIHTTEKDLGFRCTSVDWNQITFPDESQPRWVFNKSVENLRLQRYMQGNLQQKLLHKHKADRPKNFSCPRCIKYYQRRGDTRGFEQEQTIKGHTLDKGCDYVSYDCFTDLEFAEDFHSVCPLAQAFKIINEEKAGEGAAESNTDREESILDQAAVKLEGDPNFRSCFGFNRKCTSLNQDFDWFHQLKDVFGDPELRQFMFQNPQLTAEECATLFFLAQDQVRKDFYLNYEKDKAETDRHSKEVSEEEYFGAVVVKNKDILAQCQKCPKALMDWLAANDKELCNLIDRGVLKLVKVSELKNLSSESYELIPSLVVYSKKPPNPENPEGKCKARIVACGNFQIPADKESEGLQTGVYAGTTSQIVWRSLVTIFAQSRGTVAAMDVSEAFTQTDDKSQSTGGRTVQTYLRLPSQWKSILLPTYLKRNGCSIENYNQYLLKVLKSIYGETFAPKRWQETLKRVLEGHGFKQCNLEESLYFRIKNNQVCVISTYVDDVWLFSQNPEDVAVLYDISRQLRCTPGEILCGAPDWMWQNDVSRAVPISGQAQTGLSDKQKQIQEFYKPLKGEKRFGVATKEDPLTYVSIDLYFHGSTDKSDMLHLDQVKYVEKSWIKLKEKGVFNDSEVIAISSLRAERFNHLYLNENIEKNPLLSKQELTLLRAGVNTLSFYALSVGIHLQAALGQIARGQANGRKRHLDALKDLIFYSYQQRFFSLQIECPTCLHGQMNTLKKLTIFSTAHVDSSLGMSNALGTDAHARQ